MENDIRQAMDQVHVAKLKAFKECVRILNDKRYKTERRVEACAAFPLDELERAFQIVDPASAGFVQ